MNRVRIIILSIFLSAVVAIDCQGNDTLYLQKYLEIVIENHPLIKRANLNDDISAAQILKGKGALDPKVYSDFDKKKFDDTDYFTIWQSEAKIPTTLPIDFSVGYERNDGVFLGNENTVPNKGLVYGTINLSILRGLLFDEQRYNIQAAEIKGLKSQIEKQILTREIIYQAVLTYIDWALSSNTLTANRDYLKLIRLRHQNVIQLYVNGDSPAIDTTESRLNINSAEKYLLESRNKLIKAEQRLSLFIWNDNGQPQELNTGITSMQLDKMIATLREMSMLTNPNFTSDPLIAKLENDIEAIELETRLEKENLKPQLDLKYNTILNLGKEDLNPTFSLNDYKYAIAFQYPLLNRKTKGQLRLNEALVQQNELEKVQYLAELTTKYRALQTQEVIQDELLLVANNKLANSQLLYEAEQFKFNIGESSIFLLNSRERKLLEAQTELIKSYYTLGSVLNEILYLKLGQN